MDVFPLHTHLGFSFRQHPGKWDKMGSVSKKKLELWGNWEGVLKCHKTLPFCISVICVSPPVCYCSALATARKNLVRCVWAPCFAETQPASLSHSSGVSEGAERQPCAQDSGVVLFLSCPLLGKKGGRKPRIRNGCPVPSLTPSGQGQGLD